MNKPIVLFKRNRFINESLEALSISAEEYCELLDISEKDMLLVSNINQENFYNLVNRDPDEERLDGITNSIWSIVRNFSDMKMASSEIIQILKQPHILSDGSRLSLIDLAKNESSDIRFGLITKITEALVLDYFTEINLGPRAPALQLLNKAIAEKVFGFTVQVREKSEYSDFGDRDVLAVQMKTDSVLNEKGEEDYANWIDLLSYSKEINHAWKIVQELSSKHNVQFRLSNKAMGDQYWWCYMDDACAQGSSPAEAICLAALKYIEKSTKS